MSFQNHCSYSYSNFAVINPYFYIQSFIPFLNNKQISHEDEAKDLGVHNTTIKLLDYRYQHSYVAVCIKVNIIVILSYRYLQKLSYSYLVTFVVGLMQLTYCPQLWRHI